jgi:hypothetical protein
MEKPAFDRLVQEIYRRFPQVRGCMPRIQTCPPAKNRSLVRLPAYLLVFQSHATTTTGKTLPFYLRVVVDEQGKILKITTSR